METTTAESKTSCYSSSRMEGLQDALLNTKKDAENSSRVFRAVAANALLDVELSLRMREKKAKQIAVLLVAAITILIEAFILIADISDIRVIVAIAVTWMVIVCLMLFIHGTTDKRAYNTRRVLFGKYGDVLPETGAITWSDARSFGRGGYIGLAIALCIGVAAVVYFTSFASPPHDTSNTAKMEDDASGLEMTSGEESKVSEAKTQTNASDATEGITREEDSPVINTPYIPLYSVPTTAPTEYVVPTSIIEETPYGTSNTGLLLVKTNLNVRAGPGTEYDKIDLLLCGTLLDYIDYSSGWYTIRYNSKDAYVSGDYVLEVTRDQLDCGEIGAIETLTDVNIRSGPGTDYHVLGGADVGWTFVYTDVVNGWYKVYYEGQDAYIKGQYVSRIYY